MSALSEIAALKARLEDLEKQEQAKAKEETLKATSLDHNLNNLETIIEHKKGSLSSNVNWAKIAGTKWSHKCSTKEEHEEAEEKIQSCKDYYSKNLQTGFNGEISYLEAILGALKIMDQRLSKLESKDNKSKLLDLLNMK